MKITGKIHLPGGQVYTFKVNEKKMTDESIVNLRRFFGEVDQVSMEVEGSAGKTTLILWGQTLKNSFVTIEEKADDPQ